MPSDRTSINRQKQLVLLLRIIGTSSLTAIVFVFVPYSWMNAIYGQMGMGILPDQPVVGYLSRSLSGFYALFGGLLWLISNNPARHRAVLIFLGYALAIFGGLLLFIDWFEGMPFFWKVWEGPFVIFFGLVVLRFSKSI